MATITDDPPQLTDTELRDLFRDTPPAKTREELVAFARLLSTTLAARSVDGPLMRWLGDDSPLLNGDTLHDVIAEVYAGIAERKRVEMQKELAAEAARKAAAPAKPTKRRIVLEIARKLRISTRRTYQLIEEGTTRTEYAAVFAELRGGKPGDYLRRARRSGRRQDVVGALMKIGMREFPFTGYVLANPEFEGFLEEVRTHRAVASIDFEAIEEMMDFARDADIALDIETAQSTWDEYKRWVIRKLSALAISQV